MASEVLSHAWSFKTQQSVDVPITTLYAVPRGDSQWYGDVNSITARIYSLFPNLPPYMLGPQVSAVLPSEYMPKVRKPIPSGNQETTIW